MKLSYVPLLAIVLAIAGCAKHLEPGPKTLTGHFTYMDTSLPGCGIVAWASRATFVVNGSGKKIKLAVPCIEMQFAENAAGQNTPLKIGDRYSIVLVREKPTPDMKSPYFLNKNPWYLSRVSQ